MEQASPRISELQTAVLLCSWRTTQPMPDLPSRTSPGAKAPSTATASVAPEGRPGGERVWFSTKQEPSLPPTHRPLYSPCGPTGMPSTYMLCSPTFLQASILEWIPPQGPIYRQLLSPPHSLLLHHLMPPLQSLKGCLEPTSIMPL